MPQAYVLAMPFDGAHNSTDMLDVSGRNHEITRVADPGGTAPTLTASAKKFGPTSCSVQTSGHLLLPTSSDFAMGSGDFTIQTWAWRRDNRLNSGLFQLSTQNGIDEAAGSCLSVCVRPNENNARRWAIWSSSGETISTTAATYASWVHIALERYQGTLTLYVNGAAALSLTDSYDYTGTSGVIGVFEGLDGRHFGYLDDLRIDNGVAYFKGSFTPPTATVCVSLSVGLLAAIESLDLAAITGAIPPPIGNLLAIELTDGISYLGGIWTRVAIYMDGATVQYQCTLGDSVWLSLSSLSAQFALGERAKLSAVVPRAENLRNKILGLVGYPFRVRRVEFDTSGAQISSTLVADVVLSAVRFTRSDGGMFAYLSGAAWDTTAERIMVRVSNVSYDASYSGMRTFRARTHAMLRPGHIAIVAPTVGDEYAIEIERVFMSCGEHGETFELGGHEVAI